MALLLGLHAALLAWSAYRHSPIVCEVGHLPAGLSHVQLGRFDLYRVNPPLVRCVAATAVALVGANTDWTRYDTDPLRRAEYEVGQDFLRAQPGAVVLAVHRGTVGVYPFEPGGRAFLFPLGVRPVWGCLGNAGPRAMVLQSRRTGTWGTAHAQRAGRGAGGGDRVPVLAMAQRTDR